MASIMTSILSQRRHSITKYIAILLMLGLIYTIIYNIGEVSYENVNLLGLIALLQFVLTLYSWYKIRHTLFDAYVVFIVAFYAFNISQPILDGLGVDYTYRRLLGDFLSIEEYYNATFYSMICLLFFHLGAIIEVDRNEQTPTISNNSIRITLNAIYRASIMCVVLSFPFYLYGFVRDYSTVKIYGYAGLYEVESTSRVFDMIADLYIPSFIAYYFSVLARNKKQLVPLVIMVVTIFIPPLVLGGRSNAMIILSVIIVVYSSFKRISLKESSVIAIVVVFALLLMNIAGQLRQIQDKSIYNYEEMTKDNEENPIVSTLSEMGWSMYPLGKTITVVPTIKPYDYGASFLWSAFSVVPNIGIWKEHPSKTHSAAAWLNRYSGFSYGIGYSLIAECYNDFGSFCFIFIFFIGMLFTHIFKYVSAWSAHNNPMQYVLAILFLWFSIKCVRNGCDGIVRGAAYCMLPLYCLFKMMGAKR